MDGDKLAEEKKQDVTISERKGMASIKDEFLKKLAKHAPIVDVEPSAKKLKLDSEAAAESAAAEVTKSVTVEEQPADFRDKNNRGPRRKGQNKNRAKFSAQRADRKDRLCSALLHEVQCTYGDKCKFSHDIDNFMKTKPADIGTECVHFKLKGYCNFSFACRFAGSHVQDVDGTLKNIKSDDPKFTSGSQYSVELNKLDKEVLFKLRKRKYDFSKASTIQKATLKLVAEYVKANVKKYSTKTSENDLREELIIMRDEEKAATAEKAVESVKSEKASENMSTAPPSSESTKLSSGMVAEVASTTENSNNETNQRTEDKKTKDSTETNEAVENVKEEAASNQTGETASDELNGKASTTVNGSITPTPKLNEETTNTNNTHEKTTPTTIPTNAEETTTVSVSVNEKTPTGCIMDEDVIKLRAAEKKTIDFRNKLYLAPLTTVGNLPFRRVCKEFGAEITCGEMALATKILQGTATEWALLKRHKSEDIFGAQICGAFSDSMANCTQLLNETCSLDFIDINVGCPIDMIYDMGAGSALMRRTNRFQEIARSMVGVSTIPITAKIRTGISANKNTAHHLIPRLKEWGISLITLHGRSREQRYTRVADWKYIDECAQLSAPVPFYGGGDILNFEDYNAAMKTSIDGTMIARGALIKPWLFTEIKEQRHWDISSTERLDILKKFTDYGLEHWGSDCQGVETTRRFLLEWLSFLHRYIPVGLLERVPNRINDRPPPYVGRNDLETLMISSQSADWVKISEMLLGKVPDAFFFVPKHRANSYEDQSLKTS